MNGLQGETTTTGAAVVFPADLVFDFSGLQRLDVAGLSLLLTARQQAHEDRRNVWVTGVPDRTWHILEALGLEELFLPLPDVDDTAN